MLVAGRMIHENSECASCRTFFESTFATLGPLADFQEKVYVPKAGDASRANLHKKVACLENLQFSVPSGRPCEREGNHIRSWILLPVDLNQTSVPTNVPGKRLQIVPCISHSAHTRTCVRAKAYRKKKDLLSYRTVCMSSLKGIRLPQSGGLQTLHVSLSSSLSLSLSLSLSFPLCVCVLTNRVTHANVDACMHTNMHAGMHAYSTICSIQRHTCLALCLFSEPPLPTPAF